MAFGVAAEPIGPGPAGSAFDRIWPAKGPCRDPAGGGLVLRGLARQFGGTFVLHRLDVAVGPGEIVAVLGAPGSGKSTLARILAGALSADAGTVELGGRSLDGLDPAGRSARGLAVVHQDLALAENLDAADNIFLGRLRHRRILGLLPVLDRGGMRRAAAELLARFGQALQVGVPVRELSGGERQTVAIARGLADHPRVLVLDDPEAALSAARRTALWRELRALAATGAAVLVTGGADMEPEADRVFALRQGRIVGKGTPHAAA